MSVMTQDQLHATQPGQSYASQLPQSQPGGQSPPAIQPLSQGGMNPTGVASDPFGYTNGSLLTPWTRTFSYTPQQNNSSGGGGGPAPAGPQGFSFEPINASFRDIGSFQGPEAYKGPDPFSSGVADYKYNPYAAGNFSLSSLMNGQGRPQFQGTPGLTVDRFSPQAQFQAPTGTDDPSFAFRRQQGQEALEASASARGVLRGGDTMKALIDYGQQAGSQEYAAAYGRAFDLWNAKNSLDLNAYDRNSQAGILENQTAYGRASDAYNRGNDAYNQDASLGLSAFQANEQARQYAQSANTQGEQYQNESAYGRRASEYDRNFANSRDVYQMNTSNSLNAYQANAASAAAMGNLALQSQFGNYDRNYQSALTSYQIDDQHRQEAAAQAAAGAASGRAQEQQDYARAMQQYQMEYGQFNDNQNAQFSRLYAMASLGQNAAAQQGAFGGGYFNNSSDAAYGAANARAAGVIGAGNAAAQMGSTIGSFGSGVANMGMYYGMGAPAQRNTNGSYAGPMG